MSNKPKVSLIVPIYNVEKYLVQCLESIMNQTLHDIEIITVDDGSPDNCGKIIDEYANKDKRIKPIHKENGGYGSAINTGLAVATGEYIGIVEADDWCEITMFEKLYNKAKETKADLVKCYFNNPPIDNKERKREIETFYKIAESKIEKNPDIILLHCSIWSCIYKKDMLYNFNIKMDDKKNSYYQDFLWQIQTFIGANKIAYVPELLYNWRQEPNQKSSSNLKNEKLINMVDITKKCISYAKKNNRKDLIEYIYNYGICVNFLFFKRVYRQYKKKYFYKIKELILESKEDKFLCKFLNNSDKMNYNLFLKYNYKQFLTYNFFHKIYSIFFKVKESNKVYRIYLFGIRILKIRKK